ncbi:hypothetical protein [Geobacillus phage TP-84]|uniref:Uncharacterized protein n=1 Tax=Geobacillus phage TP-84 TaxID=1965361 RepID=A0A1U9WQJ5_9CAUD|nr:hypothetical protein MUK65_gp38 [Geobacillus phage TP-84]AQY55056.1 hypothetical protein [Geobacillus phage TP-84]
MKPYDPIPMAITLKPHQTIRKGEVIQETIGGKVVKFKVIDIRMVEIRETHALVGVMAREIGEGDAE